MEVRLENERLITEIRVSLLSAIVPPKTIKKIEGANRDTCAKP